MKILSITANPLLRLAIDVRTSARVTPSAMVT